MKFYKNKDDKYDFFDKIVVNELTAILEFFNTLFSKHSYVSFYKSGKLHNDKNASFIGDDYCKQFCLNDKYFGNQYKFTKQS